MKSDSQIKQDVIDELNREPTVNAAQVGVQVKDGAVTPGVTNVIDNLSVSNI